MVARYVNQSSYQYNSNSDAVGKEYCLYSHMRVVLVFIVLLLSTTAMAQSGAGKRAFKSLSEGDLEKAEKHILKGLEKDTLDPLLQYDIALFLLASSEQAVDSANSIERKSRTLWTALSVDEQAKYAKNEFTESNLNSLRSTIDSLGFARARELNTEESYQRFMDEFPEAVQTGRAVTLRDSVAFGTASSQNTYESYLAFMKKYPTAIQFAEAQKRYDRLLFEVSTRSGTLAALLKFLSEHPDTPYRSIVENDIFEIQTAVPSTEKYRAFLEDFPKSRSARHARNYLYYQERTDFRPNSRVWGDSIVQIHEVNRAQWIATYDKENATFLDGSGKDKFRIDREDLNERYECEPLTEDLIVGQNVLFSRLGEQIHSGAFDDVDFLGLGLVRISHRGRQGVITVWGRNVMDVDYAEVQMVDSLFLMARRGGRFALFSLTGRQLTGYTFDNCRVRNDLLEIQRGGKMALLPVESLAEDVANRTQPDPAYVDELEWLDDKYIWIRSGEREGIVDYTLKEMLPMEERPLDITSVGFVSEYSGKVTLRSRDLFQKFSTEEKLLDLNDGFARFTSKDGEGLFDMASFRIIAFPDSAKLIGRTKALAFGQKLRVYDAGQNAVDAPPGYRGYRLLKHLEDEKLLLESNRGGFILHNGALVKVPSHTDITMLNDSLYIITVNGKKGIWNVAAEKFDIPARFDGIANFDGRDVSVFRNKKFGLYRVPEGHLVPPQSEKLLTAFGDSLFLIVENGKRGIVDRDNKSVIPSEYDEIQYWTDSLALVKETEYWQFYNLIRGTVSQDKLNSVKILEGTGDERYLLAMIEGKFGIFSASGGEIIPATFDDILNIGTPEEPVFFTETYVDAADLHVVIYFDKSGNLLLRQAVDPDLFYEIYCDN